MNYDFKTFFKEGYGKRPLPDGKGYIEIVPTTQKFFEKDDSDVRLDRVYVYDSNGNLIRTYLQDKMGQRFVDNFPDIKDDPAYFRGFSKWRKTKWGRDLRITRKINIVER